MALKSCPKSPSKPQLHPSKPIPTQRLSETSPKYAEQTTFRSSSTTKQASQFTPHTIRGGHDWFIRKHAWLYTYKPDPTGIDRMAYSEIAKAIRTRKIDPLIEIQGITGPLSAWRVFFDDALEIIYHNKPSTCPQLKQEQRPTKYFLS